MGFPLLAVARPASWFPTKQKASIKQQHRPFYASTSGRHGEGEKKKKKGFLNVIGDFFFFFFVLALPSHPPHPCMRRYIFLPTPFHPAWFRCWDCFLTMGMAYNTLWLRFLCLLAPFRRGKSGGILRTFLRTLSYLKRLEALHRLLPLGPGGRGYKPIAALGDFDI